MDEAHLDTPMQAGNNRRPGYKRKTLLSILAAEQQLDLLLNTAYKWLCASNPVDEDATSDIDAET